MKGAIFMMRYYDGFHNFNMYSIENMPVWMRQEKYYNCDDFIDMLFHKTKKNKKQKKATYK